MSTFKRDDYRVAPDGWFIKWNLNVDPAWIDVWNAAGVRQYVISGKLDALDVQAEVEKVLAEHDGQMRLL